MNIIEALTQRGAGFKSLKDTWADTDQPARSPDADGSRRLG